MTCCNVLYVPWFQKWVKKRCNRSEFHLEKNYYLQNWYFSNAARRRCPAAPSDPPKSGGGSCSPLPPLFRHAWYWVWNIGICENDILFEKWPKFWAIGHLWGEFLKCFWLALSSAIKIDHYFKSCHYSSKTKKNVKSFFWPIDFFLKIWYINFFKHKFTDSAHSVSTPPVQFSMT